MIRSVDAIARSWHEYDLAAGVAVADELMRRRCLNQWKCFRNHNDQFPVGSQWDKLLCVPETHPLATMPSVRLAQLDGARLLTWNPPGSPLTDLILTELAAAGCAVACVQARVTGAPLAELADLEAVALMPAGWPQIDGIAQIPLAEKIELPLLVLWRAGVHSPAVERVRARLRAP